MFGKEKKLVMCQNCRALVDPSESTCPMCGNESVPERRAAAASMESTGFTSKLILAINVILFIVMGAVGVRSGGGAESFLQSASPQVLSDFGMLIPQYVWDGQWWRLVTANFLHIGLMHLMFNSFALFQVGPLVEEVFGEQKFISAYVFTGVMGFTACLFLNWPGAGASASLYGLIGLMAAYGYRLGGTFGKALMKQMLIWAAVGTVFALIVGANHVAHAGGFVSGGVLGFLITGDAPTTASAYKRWNALAVVSILLVVGSFVFVGIKYGASQRRSDNVQAIIRLDRLVNEAGATLESREETQNRNGAGETVRKLRSLASDISGIQPIDERSTEIRARLAAVLNQRADALEKAEKSPPEPLRGSSEEIAAAQQVFDDYDAWVASILDQYGLVRTRN